MWSRHLSHRALMALVEGIGDDRDRRHVAGCERCRLEVETLRATLRVVRDVDVPEPSPLFWSHLSQRVSEAVAREEATPVRGTGWGDVSWRSGAWLAATALLVVVAVSATWRGDTSTATDVASDATAPGPAALVAAADSEWEFLLDLAEIGEGESAGDDVEAIRPGAADRVLMALSDAEREALVQILETAVRMPSS